LQVREGGRQKVCVARLMENELHDLSAVVHVTCRFFLALYLQKSYVFSVV